MADQEEARSDPKPPSIVTPGTTQGSHGAAAPSQATPYAKVASDSLPIGIDEGVTPVVGKGGDLGGRLTPDERAFASLYPVETMLGDPLGEVARKERRSLLGVSALAIFVGLADLLPTKIENFGITFTPPRRQALLVMFVAVVVYYLVAFIVYSLSDYLLHRRKVHVARMELKKREALGSGSVDPVTLVEPEWRPVRFVDRTSRSRTFVDFIVPLIVALLGITSLVYAVVHVETNVPSELGTPGDYSRLEPHGGSSIGEAVTLKPGSHASLLTDCSTRVLVAPDLNRQGISIPGAAMLSQHAVTNRYCEVSA